MKKIIIYTITEYLSLTMILSYIFVHNIFLVFFGIIISLYLINKKFVNSLMNSIRNRIFFIDKLLPEARENKETKKYISSTTDLNKENRDLTLVESIEELGYIPCKDKNINKHIA